MPDGHRSFTSEDLGERTPSRRRETGREGRQRHSFFSKAGYEKEEGFVQGVLVAGELEKAFPEEGNIVYFQPLGVLLAKLNEKTTHNLELLTTANQKRP